MSKETKTSTPTPPKRLKPRRAEAPEAAADVPEVAIEAETGEAMPTPAPPAAKPARKPGRVQETVARQQKVLAEALAKAQAIKYDPPEAAPARKAAKSEKGEKTEKAPKARKQKLVRDSYAMPEAEYGRIGELKKRMAALGCEVKKSELLRGGLAALAALDDTALKAMMAKVERIKTGRPAK